MSRESKDPAVHPVPRTLEALDKLLETCKEIAILGALDEVEGIALHEITETIIALYENFAERELAAATWPKDGQVH